MNQAEKIKIAKQVAQSPEILALIMALNDEFYPVPDLSVSNGILGERVRAYEASRVRINHIVSSISSLAIDVVETKKVVAPE